MKFVVFLSILGTLVAAYDDASLMQQNMGVEAATSSREKYNEMIAEIRRGRKQMPSMGKLRDMALDGLMNDLTEESPQSDSIFAQIIELLVSIDNELQTQKTTDQGIIDAHLAPINDCNTQNQATDDSTATAFETASEAHRVCRVVGTVVSGVVTEQSEDAERSDAESACGTMTQEMANRRAGLEVFYGETSGSVSAYNPGVNYDTSEMAQDCDGFGGNPIDAITQIASRPNSGDATTIGSYEDVKTHIIDGTNHMASGFDWYAAITRIMYWYNAVERMLGPLMQPCETALHDYATKRVACHALQQAQESAFCQHLQVRRETCANRNTCYTTNMGLYEADWATYLPLAVKRFHEGTMVRYVYCLIEDLIVNNTDIQACLTTFSSTAFTDNATDSFNITRITPDAEAPCNTSQVEVGGHPFNNWPASPAWQAVHYGSFAAQGSRTPFNDDLTSSHCCASTLEGHSDCCASHGVAGC